MTQQQAHPRRAFSLAALAEAEDVTERAAAQLAGRPAAQGVTIDGPTSLDLDDAFWLERLPEGGYRLQVSIADVGAWISARQTPMLDRAAFKRAFTRYAGERYRPMLPTLLSEDHLSLLEGRARPAITLTLTLDAQLQVGEPQIAQTALRSVKRLSYDDVERELDQPQTDLAPMLRLAHQMAEGLLRARRLRGALAAYHLPTGWITTEDGLLRRLGAQERSKAQLITAECMILANQAFAQFLASRGLLALYRNQKATAIAPERATLLQLLDTAVQHPMQVSPERISATFQLAMERARYAPTVEGHFGLNLPAYVHMTSPLRRYADLVNQQILLAALNGEEPPYQREHLEQVAASVNRHEQQVRQARGQHYLAAHDRQIERVLAADGEDQQTVSPSLERLDAKTFHSVSRMAAAGQMLPPAVEQEILRRLAAQQLYAHDLFTLLFRFQTSGDAWERVRQAALHALACSPEHAPGMLLMGQHALGWGEAHYEFTAEQGERAAAFLARASVRIADREYQSGWQQAAQKSGAKQLASAELLTRIARQQLEDDASQPFDFSVPALASGPALPNYKGQLLEYAQARQWGQQPTYTLEEQSGPSHAPLFVVGVVVSGDGQTYTAQGEGTTRARAEHRAAQQVLQLLPPADVSRLSVPANLTAKSALQEMLHKARIKTLIYTFKHAGQGHAGTFTCTCAVTAADGRTLTAKGKATTKQQAAQAAAAQMLARLAEADSPPDGS